MAKDVITRFKLETTQFDSKIKDAAKGLSEYTRTASNAGKEFQKFTKDNIDAARALGTMATSSMDAKGKVNELVGAFNDAAKAYNALTKEQQRSDFGKAMSQSLTQLQQRIRETKEELRNLSSGSGGGLFGGGKLDGMLQVFGGNLMTKGAGMLAGLANEVGDMIKQGTELAKQGEGIRIAFERLGRGDILQGLREATHGTVTDLELMKAAVKFNDFKLPVEELGTMLAFAQRKAKDTGQSVDYMVDSIVTGLGRKSLMILDNLGLSASEIKEKMAETGDMTKAVGAIIREQMAAAGDYVETAADRAQQANVSLQNKMEELGRKFGPLQEASNNFWTSMKIGILDVIGGPLANLLNKLTEAGRLMNAYSQMGGSGKVGQMTANLAGAREGNRQSIYQKQQQQFLNYINPREQQIKDIRAWQRGERGEVLQGRINAITQKYGSLDATKIQAEVDAAKKMLADYKQAAKGILTPVKVDINTSQAEQNVESLNKKLADLQAQRKKAIAAGDTDLSKNLQKQINQTKADIRGLDPNALKTTGSVSKKLTDAEKAQQRQDERIRKQYEDAMRKAEREIVLYAGEISTAIEVQKKIDKANRDLEAAQKRLADAQRERSVAKESGDLKAYYAADKKVTQAQEEVTRMETVKVNIEQGKVDLPNMPKDNETVNVNFKATTQNIDAQIAHLKDEMSQLQIGSIEFKIADTSLVDMTTLQTIVNEQLKAGLTLDPAIVQSFYDQIVSGADVTNEKWAELLEKINAVREAMDMPELDIDLRTGKSEGKSKEEESESLVDKSSKLLSGLSSVASGLQQMGIKLPEGVQQVLGVAQGLMTVVTGIGSIISVFQIPLQMANNYELTANNAALVANTAAMISLEAALWANTASGWFPFANGGVVHAAGGIVTGNTYSGDKIPALLNAGEVVLNRAQAGVLASELEGNSMNDLQLTTFVDGEKLGIVINNNGRRKGKGKLVTTKFVKG